ncbi:methyltransferase domain-containing protein [Microdochium nivale]|nr:methyltransferase domain-containing protein [Microdochium nivale]
MPEYSAALQAQYAAIQGVLDEAAVNMIASGEAILKRPGRILLAQMGLVRGEDENTTITTTTTAPTGSFTLLDNACGPGLIAGVLQEDLPRDLLLQSRIVCADINGNLVEILEQRAEAQQWAGVETAVLDAQNPGLPDESFSHCTVNFGMHVIPDPDAVLKATKALLKPSGVFGLTTMHSSTVGWTADIRSALSSLPFPTEPLPAILPMTANGRPEWSETAGVERALQDHGFDDVLVRVVEHRSPCFSGADFVGRFGMMIRMVTGAHWSKETRRRALVDGEEEQGTGTGRGFRPDGAYRETPRREARGQAWELHWKMLVATCRKPEA